eukprot:SAG25_NODE_14762_length_251_cov_0.684211_1_plen_32_part_10
MPFDTLAQQASVRHRNARRATADLGNVLRYAA